MKVFFKIVGALFLLSGFFSGLITVVLANKLNDSVVGEIALEMGLQPDYSIIVLLHLFVLSVGAVLFFNDRIFGSGTPTSSMSSTLENDSYSSGSSMGDDF